MQMGHAPAPEQEQALRANLRELERMRRACLRFLTLGILTLAVIVACFGVAWKREPLVILWFYGGIIVLSVGVIGYWQVLWNRVQRQIARTREALGEAEP
jgi:hypothetical protein